MTDHGWFDDHHPHETGDDYVPPADADEPTYELPDPDDHFAAHPHTDDDPVPAAEDVHHEPPAPPEEAPQDIAEPTPEDLTPEDLAPDEPGPEFPPALDLGELPEPVDGHPWIDTGSLGITDGIAEFTTQPVDPAELAEYAATELPPAADPWATLAESDDPATAALARWWGENPS